MDLNVLFEDTDWTERDLAGCVGVSQPTLNRIRNRVSNASLGLAFRIQWETDGLVKASNLPLDDQSSQDLYLIRKIASKAFQ